jgi:Caenorhabditis protein of unknown function, DUF268
VQNLDPNDRPWNIHIVAGSISTWVEAIVLARAREQGDQRGAPCANANANVNATRHYQNRVMTTVYNEIQSESPMIQFVSMERLKGNPPEPLFDMIVTYSGIEQDGLGRYGDPINPGGDFCAMDEYSLM